MQFKVEGIISAMVTPFTKNGEYVDFEKVGPLAQWIVDKGMAGLFPCGTTGEGMLMTSEERMEVLEEVIAAVGKKTKVIAHTGTFELATTIELTRHAQECGAYAAGIVAPGYYSYDDLALEQYYTAIAKAVKGFPILLYNIPGCAKNRLSPELVRKLADKAENIVGLKDSGGNLMALTQMISEAPKGFHVINGVDDYGFQAFMTGASAAVSGTSNVIPELYKSIYDCFRKGDYKKAVKEQLRMEQATRILEYGAKTSIFKEGMRMRGFDPGYVRPPQRELTAAEKKKLAKGLESLGLL